MAVLKVRGTQAGYGDRGEVGGRRSGEAEMTMRDQALDGGATETES